MGQHIAHPFRRGLGLACSGQVMRNAGQIALVVGSSLNLINQGHAILHGFAGLDVPKFLLNFLVPYLVATYSAVKTTLGAEPKDKASSGQVGQGTSQDGA